jgi:hypothetical protein
MKEPKRSVPAVAAAVAPEPAPVADLVSVKLARAYRPEGSPEGTRIPPGETVEVSREEARRLVELKAGSVVV